MYKEGTMKDDSIQHEATTKIVCKMSICQREIMSPKKDTWKWSPQNIWHINDKDNINIYISVI